ncbi:MAG TPA: DUF2807 domain-containing protein [Chitinophagaceae bacterium]
MKQLFYVHRRSKKLLLPLFALLLGSSARSQAFPEKTGIGSKSITIAEPFKEIEVVGNATIILTNSPADQVIFSGDAKALEVTKAGVRKGRLLINVDRKKSREKITVYVPANKIHSLIASGNSKILSSGMIRVSDLEILLRGYSNVAVRYDGKLKITPATGYELLEGWH